MTDLAVSGNRIFHLSEVGGMFRPTTLNITDVSDPRRPAALLTDYRFDDQPRKIAVSGNIVFVATSGGLSILDISDPSHPVEEGSFHSSWEPSDLAVVENLAFLILPEEGLRVVDVSDATHPLEIGSWPATWEALDLEIANGTAFVADGSAGVRVLDVTNPAAPAEIGSLATQQNAVKISVAGPNAVVGLAGGGFEIVDVTVPAEPEGVGIFAAEGEHPDVVLVDRMAYLAGNDFQVVDLSTPESASTCSSFGYSSSAMDIAISNGVEYIATGDTGLFVHDPSVHVYDYERFVDTPGFARGVTLHGHLALVSDDRKGVRIIDVSNPEDLVEVGFVDTPGQARRVAVAGDHAYVADGDGGIRILDISTPAMAAEVGAIETANPAVDVAVSGDFVYIADGNLRILNISDPAQPIEVPIPSPIRATALAIDDYILYVTDRNAFQIIEVAVPSDPQVLVRVGLTGEATDLEISGSHAFVAFRRCDYSDVGGVDIIDVANVILPEKIGSWNTKDDASGIALSDGRIYVATESNVVPILDTGCLTTYWVEIVAHANGIGGSQWRSDVIISHEADRRVALNFILHTVDGQFTAAASVDSRQQGVFEDIVGLLGYEGTGALEIQSNLPITISSRIYNQTGSGTFGTHYRGYRLSKCLRHSETVSLYGLRQEEGKFRTNISVTNTGTEAGNVWIMLYRTDGKELIRYPVQIEPGMVFQDVEPFKNRAGEPELGWGYAKVWVGFGQTSMLTSATVIDSRTNDAVVVPMVPWAGVSFN